MPLYCKPLLQSHMCYLIWKKIVQLFVLNPIGPLAISQSSNLSFGHTVKAKWWKASFGSVHEPRGGWPVIMASGGERLEHSCFALWVSVSFCVIAQHLIIKSLQSARL